MYNLKLLKKTLANKYFISNLLCPISEYAMMSTKDALLKDSERFQKRIKKSYIQRAFKGLFLNKHINTFILYSKSFSLMPIDFLVKYKELYNLKIFNFLLYKDVLSYLVNCKFFPIYFPNLFWHIFKIL